MHHELPERLDVDWFRTRARSLLRAYRAEDPEAVGACATWLAIECRSSWPMRNT